MIKKAYGDAERTILDDLTDAEDLARFELAKADIKAGRVVPHEEVVAWLETWSDPNGPPAPRHWLKYFNQMVTEESAPTAVHRHAWRYRPDTEAHQITYPSLLGLGDT